MFIYNYFMIKRKSKFFSRYLNEDGSYPDFIIVGTPKSGTTSLYSYLSEHEEIFPALEKEPFYFFSDGLGKYKKGIRWYKSFFPSDKEKGNKITGEASAPYLYYSESVKNIKKEVPNGKFIILLRNPVDRLFSHYQMGVRSGRQNRTFEQTTRPLFHYGLENCPVDWINQSYYLPQIKRWFKYFPNRDQTLIIKSEDLFNDTQETFDLVCEFLSISKQNIKSLPVKNKGNYKDSIDPKLRKKLEDTYGECNKELEEYLGIKFNWF